MVRDNLSKLTFTKRSTGTQHTFSSDAKSLFLKILPLTTLDSRFWQIKKTPGQRNSNQSKILRILSKKLRDIPRCLTNTYSALSGLSLSTHENH